MGLVVVILLISVGRQVGGRLPQFAEWVANLGILGPIIFIAGYAGATVAFVPGSVLTLAAGAIFGLAQGVTYVMLGAALGACLAFLVARYFARTAIEQRLSRHSSFAAIDRAIGREGRKIVFLLRFSGFVGHSCFISVIMLEYGSQRPKIDTYIALEDIMGQNLS